MTSRDTGERVTARARYCGILASRLTPAIPALPGGWGVGDAAFFAFLPAAGVPAGKAVALSLTYRLVHTLLSLPGGLWLAGVRREARIPQ